MIHPYERRINDPVAYEDWKDILADIPMVANSKSSPSSARKSKVVGWTGPPITETWQRNLRGGGVDGCKGVEEEDSFCILRPDASNVTSQFNQLVFQHVTRDGTTAEFGHVRDHERNLECYVKLSPQFLALTEDNMKVLPEQCWKMARSIRGFGVLESGKATAFVLIWKPYNSGVRSKGLKKGVKNRPVPVTLIPGNPVPDDDETAPLLLVLESSQNMPFTSRLRARLHEPTLLFKTARSVPGKRLTADELHHARSAAAIVVFLDGRVDERHPTVFGHLTPPERMFLAVDRGDDRIVGQAKEHRQQLGLPISHVFELDQGIPSLDLVQAVRGALDRARQSKLTLEKCKGTWMDIRFAVNQLLDEMTTEKHVEPEIVQNALLAPFLLKVTQTSRWFFSSQENAQVEFIRVAVPLYEQAQQVYALNTDQHSTFWDLLNPKDRDRLLTLCPTVRLFLYSNPRAMVNEIATLNALAGHYAELAGDTVKLLVGDLATYRQAFGVKVDKDMALIQHQSGAWYQFSLSKERFEGSLLKNDKESVLRELLTELGNIAKSGRVREYTTPQSRVFPFFQWFKDFERDELDEFKNCVKRVFAATYEMGVHRILTFQNDGTIPAPAFNQIVISVENSIKAQIRRLADSGQGSIKYGSLRSGGPLRLMGKSGARAAAASHDNSHIRHDDSRRILIMHFETEKALEEFSTSPNLNDIRHKLYMDIFQALKAATKSGDPEVVPDQGIVADPRFVAEVMGLVGNRYMTIQDYSDRHQMDDLMAQLRK